MNRVGEGRNRWSEDQQRAENHAGRSRPEVNAKESKRTFFCKGHYDVPSYRKKKSNLLIIKKYIINVGSNYTYVSINGHMARKLP